MNKYKNMSNKVLFNKLIKYIYLTFKMVFSMILAILITYQVSFGVSLMDIFANSPILFWYSIVFILTLLWYMILILIKYVEALVYKNK